MMLTSMGTTFESLLQALKNYDSEILESISHDDQSDFMAGVLTGQRVLGKLLTHASEELTCDEIADAGWLIVGLAELARIWHDNA
jgi:hypothetical protein